MTDQDTKGIPMFRRLTACLLLALGLVSPLGAEEVAPGLDRAALRAEIRAYLLENPEVIYEAIQILEERRRLAEATAELDLVRANAEALRNDGYSHVVNPEGTLTVVEFFDYRCGYCKRAHPDMQSLVRMNRDIRYVRKEFPILGPDSLLAARAAIAVQLLGDGEKYAAFSDKLMEFGGPINDQVIDKLAERVGVDPKAMRARMDDPEIARRLEATRALAERLNVGGTPTFVFGDKIVRGFIPLEEMAKVVQLARNAQN